MQANLKNRLDSLIRAASSLTRPQLAVITLLVLTLCVGATFAYVRSRPRVIAVHGGGTGGTAQPGERTITIHVAGAVTNPGLYKLGEGSRVADAIAKAGGQSPDASLDDLNLAGKLADGQKVMVPRKLQQAGQPPTGAPAAAAETSMININTATAEQLDALPGVGPAMAGKIVAYRQKNGPFSAADDLDSVPGIGPAKLEALRDLVTI